MTYLWGNDVNLIESHFTAKWRPDIRDIIVQSKILKIVPTKELVTFGFVFKPFRLSTKICNKVGCVLLLTNFEDDYIWKVNWICSIGVELNRSNALKTINVVLIQGNDEDKLESITWEHVSFNSFTIHLKHRLKSTCLAVDRFKSLSFNSDWFSQVMSTNREQRTIEIASKPARLVYSIFDACHWSSYVYWKS